MSATNAHIANARLNYNKGQLLENTINANPYQQFDAWLHQAITEQVQEPYAMHLGTVNDEGYPSVRVVLLREIIMNEGLVFFTNYASNKGKAIDHNTKVSVNFFWEPMERQVRAQGLVEKLSPQKSDAYFNSRPHESKIGAIVSKQSQIIASRELLDENYNKALVEYANATPARPQHWGGYLIKLNQIEFWQGRSSRMHDRINYTLNKNNEWNIIRLQP
ncbi:MAG: pyridoxamine 5'-phosphate oxidase [Bacteroidia bacterium]|nr:pyridoxamine 5'-phosphate oxidase [Bacteroidia bacterium]